MKSLNELLNSSLEDLMSHHLNVAKMFYEQDKSYEPLVIGYSQNSRVKIPVDFADDESKEMKLRAATICFLANDVTRYTVATEGYSLEGGNVEEYEKLRSEGKRISDHPNCIEILLCIGVSKNESLMRVYKIDPVSRELSEIEKMSEGDASGRFTELIPDVELSEEHKQQIRDLDISIIGGTIEKVDTH